MYASLVPADIGWALAAFLVAYLIGGIPWAYLIVKWVAGEDITVHGTGNVGAMNVKRTTGSWVWFTVAMSADALKGMVSVALVRLLWRYTPGSEAGFVLAMQAAVVGATLGHNYSVWLAIAKRRYVRTGKGLATGAGGLLIYSPLYWAIVVGCGLLTIAITRYLLAGQVAAAFSLPAYAVITRQPDALFCVLLGLLVYTAHHKRFMGLLRGQEPKLYTGDRMGPRG